MAVETLTGWDGREIRGVRSRGAGQVFSALDWRDLVLVPGRAIEQKAAARSQHLYAYASDDQIALQATLGHYCALQSISAEDTVTWSIFGAYSPDFWIRDLVGLAFGSSGFSGSWKIDLWRRRPHPETGTKYGPEADVVLTASNGWSCAIEAKWLNTDIDSRQGMSRDQTQLEIRRTLFESQLVIAPKSSRYSCARRNDSTFRRYFRVVDDRYEPTREARTLGNINAITWEQIVLLLSARKEAEAAIMASYLEWRLDRLPIVPDTGDSAKPESYPT